MRTAIIMPAYNEEKRIAKTLDVYLDYFDKLSKKKDFDYKIIVVINATKDKTLSIVRKYAKKNKHLDYLNLEKGGKGYAVIEGFKHALKSKYDFIGFVDADASTPPEAFHLLIKEINGSDGIIASRYIKGSIVRPKQSFKRIIGSRVYNLLIRTLFFLPYRDTQCGAKLFRSQALAKTVTSFKMSQWAFDLDVLYHLRKNGYVIKEAPTIWSDKDLSKIKFFKNGSMMALGVIRLRLLNSPLRKTVFLYDLIKSKLSA